MLGPFLTVLLAPFVAFVSISILVPLRRAGRPAAYVSIAAMLASFGASVATLYAYAVDPSPRTWEFVWAPLSTLPEIRFGLLADGLSTLMLAVVSLIALVVQVYSLGYMSAERPSSLGRYYAYHSLFATAMLGLVASHSTLQTYAFWELVGLGSYLLIGFWFEKPAASRAALKAFWTTRLGDVGFAVGVVLLWAGGGTFVFEELFVAADSGALSGALLTWGVAGLFLGAMGKSAQFPLHIWLPDAMEGPTPVSALIHAATMVAAGVYLMVRIAPLLILTPEVAQAVLFLGVLTAFVAATMALVERDIKRVLAFSTVSQLGYMMAAVGAGAGTVAFFHLTTHAFFKALLFLAAGSVIHAVHTNDVFKMGGLRKRMPLTATLFLVGGLALSGIFPFSGYFSKDEILIEMWAFGHPVAFWVLLATAGLTAFYMFRAFFVAFFGRVRSAVDAHESPLVMTLPMVPLALVTIAGGSVLGEQVTASMGDSISGAMPAGTHHEAPGWIPFAGLAVAIAGIALAWLGYGKKAFSPAAVRAASGPVATLLERRWFVDDIAIGCYRLFYLKLGAAVGWIDRYVVDGAVNFATWVTWGLADRLRGLHNGKVQDAMYAIAIGVLLLALFAFGSW